MNATWVFYGRNNKESSVNNQQDSTTNITTMVSRLPPLRCGFNESPQSYVCLAQYYKIKFVIEYNNSR